MEEYELKKIKNCIEVIFDNYIAIENEVYGTAKPYKGYILEKAKPILNDIQVIISICEKGES